MSDDPKLPEADAEGREPVPAGTTPDTPPTVPDEPLRPTPPSATMAAGRRRHGERLPALFFVASIIAGLALAVVYWQGGQTQLEGVFLAVALFGFGGGLILWAKRFMPAGPEIEPRGPLASTKEDVDAFMEDFDVGEYELERRSLLTKLMVGAGAALGIAALFPIRSLGPRPGAWLTTSPFRKGTRLLDEQGQPVRPTDLKTNGVLTVFPEGDVGDEYAQTLLIKLDPSMQLTLPDERATWTPEHLIAYSKICTHVGCPVGLFEAQFGQLLCPCHQSTFDVYDGCTVVFGPAARALPQLPLAIDDDGYVIADGPFSGPVGPGYWNQEAEWKGAGE